MSTAVLRVKRALAAAGIRDVASLERVASANEVWFADDYVVRISSRQNTRRLEYEAMVAALLPPEALYPGSVRYGRLDFGEFLVMRRSPGQMLSRAWPTMKEAQRRSAVLQLADALYAIHGVEVGSGSSCPLNPPFLAGDSLECPHQMPMPRLMRCIERARRIPGIDQALLDDAEALARKWGPTVADDQCATLVHGDLHFENVIWADGRVTAVLDFEFARAAAPDLDLEVILRFCTEPSLHVAEDYARLARREDYRSVMRWLREGYPELFEVDDLADRLNLYSLSYDLRDLVMEPPRRPGEMLPPFHAVNRLRRLVDGRGMLQLIEW